MVQLEHEIKATILVVTNDDQVLSLVGSILKGEGFRVLVATSKGIALHLSAEFPYKIDLLVCDSELTGTTGPQLGIAIRKARPEMLVMLMSGLCGGDLLVLDHGWAFIQKRLVEKKLIQMIYSVLKADNSPQSYGYDTGGEKGRLRTLDK